MIDSTDAHLLDLLQSNARTSNAELARHLEMAPSAVHQRVRKLEERGVVQGYAARVDPRAVARGLAAFIHLRTTEKLAETLIPEAVAKIPGVLEVHDIAGDDCYLVKVRVADPDALHQLIRQEIGAVPGVLSTRTTIVLKTFAEHHDLPLPEFDPPNR
jgi:Lrp/AsnC family leucine-responsive transcriptional regulator